MKSQQVLKPFTPRVNFDTLAEVTQRYERELDRVEGQRDEALANLQQAYGVIVSHHAELKHAWSTAFAYGAVALVAIFTLAGIATVWP